MHRLASAHSHLRGPAGRARESARAGSAHGVAEAGYNPEMSKKVCAVVGVGPGNGQAFARRFARAGYSIAMLSRTTGYAASIAEELPDAKAFACDVSDPGSIARAFGEVRDALGDVDVLLYNAGSGVFGTIDEISAEDFERAWQINARGLFLCAKEVIGKMREAGAGSILVTGATASLRGKPFTTAFAAAKAAQRSLAQSLARQLGPEGIHVALVIVDGAIDLPKTRERMPKKGPDDLLAPEHIAETMFHLSAQPRSAWTFELDVRPFAESW